MPSDDPLERKPDDEIHRLLRGAIGLLPLGSLLKEMFTGLVAEPAQRRRDNLLRETLERLQRLEAEGKLSWDELSSRDDFSPSFVRAVQSAMREIESEKLGLFRDAVVNTALDADLEPAIRSMLFGILERLTTQHIQMLRIIDMKAAQIHRGSARAEKEIHPDYVLSHELTEHASAEECTDPMPMQCDDGSIRYLDRSQIAHRAILLNSLEREGLIERRVDAFPETNLSPATTDTLIVMTDLGDAFLRFIQDRVA